VLLSYSIVTPKFTDENKYQKLVNELKCEDIKLEEAYNEAFEKATNNRIDRDEFQKLIQNHDYNVDALRSWYYTEIEKISTYKILFLNFGSGLIAFSLFWLLFLIVCRVSTWNDFKTVEAKGNKFLFVFSNVVLFLTIPWVFIRYFYRVNIIGDFPPPYTTTHILFPISICMGLFPCINLLLVFSLLKSKLPTKLFIRYKGEMTKSIFRWERLFVVLLVIDIILLLLFIIDGQLIPIMVSMFFIYVLLSLRAGRLNYYNHNTKEL
jgi:hypothetical protein